MNFKEGYTYHIYNRSNETIFYNRDNYLYFLKKIKLNIKPFADIISWCLMPNHFHLLLTPNKKGCDNIPESHRAHTQLLAKNIGSLLCAYTRAINKQVNRKGSLFAHKTTAKCLNEILQNKNYLEQCFHYIHQNPVRSNLCNKLSEWEFSSYKNYCGLRNGTLINKDLAFDMINYDKNNFEKQSKLLVEESIVKKLY